MKSNYPFYLYIYNAEGYYTIPQTLRNEEELNSQTVREAIKLAVEEKREVRITDSDDYLVFHSADGVLIFPRPTTEEIK